MKNAHLKYIVGGIVIVGGILGGVIAGMRKNEEQAAPPAPPPPAPKPPPAKTSFYADAADRDRRLHDATEAVQSGNQDAIKAAFARLSSEDRAKLQSMLPSI